MTGSEKEWILPLTKEIVEGCLGYTKQGSQTVCGQCLLGYSLFSDLNEKGQTTCNYHLLIFIFYFN